MLKPAEKVAVAKWWHCEGQHLIGGALSVLVPFAIVMSLLIGFVHN